MRTAKRWFALLLVCLLVFGDVTEAVAYAADIQPEAQIEETAADESAPNEEETNGGPTVQDSVGQSPDNPLPIEELAQSEAATDPADPESAEKDEASEEPEEQDQPSQEPEETEEPAEDEPATIDAAVPVTVDGNLTAVVTKDECTYGDKKVVFSDCWELWDASGSIRDDKGTNYKFYYDLTYTVDGKSKDFIAQGDPAGAYKVKVTGNLKTQYADRGAPERIEMDFVFTVHKRPVTLQYVKSVIYSGAPQTVAGAEVSMKSSTVYLNGKTKPANNPDNGESVIRSGSLRTGDELKMIIVSASVNEVGEYPFSYSYTLFDNKNQNVSANYDLTIGAIVKVSKAGSGTYNATITGTTTVVYGEITTLEELKEHFTARVNAGPGYQQITGDPEFSLTKKSQPVEWPAKGGPDAGDYLLYAVWAPTANTPEVSAKLSIRITSRPVLFRGAGSGSEGTAAYWKYYDGTPLYLPKVQLMPGEHEYTTQSGGKAKRMFYELAGEDTFDEYLLGPGGKNEVTDAAWQTNYFTVKIISDHLTDDQIKQNYEITIDMGPVGVFPRRVFLYSKSFEKTYDGKVLNNSYNGLSMYDTPEATGITMPNEYNGQGTGKLAPGGKSPLYDAYGFIPGEGIFNIIMSGNQTEVGSSENKFNYYLDTNTKLQNYMITVFPGTLTVTQGTYTATVEMDDWTWGEQAQEPRTTGPVGPNTTFEYGEPTFTYSADGGKTWTEEKPTDVNGVDGSNSRIPYQVKATWKGDGKNMPDVEATDTFHIYPALINFVASQSIVYDSEEHTFTAKPEDFTAASPMDGFVISEITGDTFADGTQWNSVTVGPDIGSAGKVNGVADDFDRYVVVRDAEGNDVTHNLIVQASVSLEITPADVYVTVSDLRKTYGGAEPAYTYTVGALQGDDGIDQIQPILDRIEIVRADAGTTAGEAVGEHEMHFVVSETGVPVGDAYGMHLGFYWEINGNPYSEDEKDWVKSNYRVHVEPGILTITPADVVVTAADSTKVYGAADPAGWDDVTVTGLVAGDDPGLIEYNVTRQPGENVGAYAVTPAGADVQGNYTVTYVPAELTITPAAVTVTANNAAKVAGAADPAFTATVTGLVAGDAPDVITYGLTRAPGEAAGQYPITPAGAELQGNYIVTYVPGTLTITPVPPAPVGPVDPGPDDGPVDDGPDDGPGDVPPVDDGPAQILEDETPLGDTPELAQIEEDETPMAAAPTVGQCCILHLLIMICAFLVTVYYTHDKKKRQKEEYETRFQLV